MKGIWLHGASGSGKTSFARAQWPDAYLKLANKWCDGYKKHKEILLDDLDKHHEKLSYYIKLWADRYHQPAETKGGMVALTHTNFIVTSQYLPYEIWDDEKTIAAINRRFKIISVIEGV